MKTQSIRRVLLLTLFWVGLNAGAGAAPNGLVVLLTDYGADSIYVGILKGSIYTKWPGVKVDTLTNSVPSFDIEAGGALLAEACREFPEGTTFCCVVDPGVGTDRKCVAVETRAGQFFVAPDNGLLTAVVERDGIRQMREASNRRYWRKGVVSSTFHGRDIFGPVSASVAKGAVLRTLGAPVKKLVRIDIPMAGIREGAAVGRVRRIDPYGNVITDLTADMLEALGIGLGDRVTVTLGDHEVVLPLAKTYASVPKGEPLLLVQSNGMVECAINQGSMARASGAAFHTPVTLRKLPGPLAALRVSGDNLVDFSVVVFPGGRGAVDRGDIHREFKLSESRVKALTRLLPDLAGISGTRTDGDGKKAPGPAIELTFGRKVFGFGSPEAVPRALRPMETALRKVYEEQMRAQIRPRIAP